MNETRSMIKFAKELEIVLVMSEIECVERIINLLKSKKVPSEVYWLKDIEQAIDFIESRNAYEGKKNNGLEKLFVVDPKFGIDRCMSTFNAFKQVNLQERSHFFVLANKLSQEDQGFFSNMNVPLIDESFEMEIGQSQIFGDKEMFTC